MATPKSTKAPAFQFYPADFLSDPNVIVMSLQERGAYITLVCVCWMQGELPADGDRLARLCGIPKHAFVRIWPALQPCFRARGDQLIHPRLEKERQKQADYRRRQSDKGKASAANRKATKPQPDINRGSTSVDVRLQPEVNSSVFSLQSSSSTSSSEKSSTAVVADARSKRPIFRGQRFVVFEWMLDDLHRMLGSHVDAFDLHEWFFTLDARTVESGTVVPQRDGGAWLQEQTKAEAIRRGLPIASVAVGKTAGNLAAAARVVARGRVQ